MSDQPLSLGTIVGGAYVIRAFECRLGDYLHYLADEIETGAVWTIAEYFPDDLAARAAEGAVAPASALAALYEEGRRRLVARAHVLARLVHPSLASSRLPVAERNTAYAITSAADGLMLDAWVRTLARPPNQSEMDTLLGPVLDALAALHGAGLLHLAITPEGIVRKHGGEGMLTRLYAGPLLPTRPPAGALADYAAPEFAAARVAEIGPRTDIYAVAASAYAVLTGTPPERPTAAPGETWMPAAIPCRSTGYRPEFLQALATSLAPEPSLRPPSAAALKNLCLEEDLAEVAAGEERGAEVSTSVGAPLAQIAAATPSPDHAQRISRVRVPWLVILLLGGGILATLTYLGMRPALPPAPHKSTFDSTPAPTVSHSSDTIERGGSATADHPLPDTQTPLQSARPLAETPDGDQSIRQQIAQMTNPRELELLAEAYPAQRETIAARLLALGYVRVVSRDAAVWLRPGRTGSFRECDNCPEMVALPAATFLMGSPSTQAGHQDDEDDTPGPAGEPVSVAIPRPFAIGKYEVTRGQFAAFVQATGHRIGTGCYAREKRRELRPELSWTAPGFDQDDNHPVTCVSWRDAVAYAQWLSARVGASYRLLTEAEWEYAARGGSDAPYAFGDKDSEICKYGNGADLMSREADPNWIVAPCRDQFRFTAPIGSFLPNAYGLYDMHGNLWEWVEDCASDSLRHFSAIALARMDERQSCSADAPRMLRGGSWSDPPQRLRSAARIAGPPDDRDYIVGFRVARTLDSAR